MIECLRERLDDSSPIDDLWLSIDSFWLSVDVVVLLHATSPALALDDDCGCGCRLRLVNNMNQFGRVCVADDSLDACDGLGAKQGSVRLRWSLLGGFILGLANITVACLLWKWVR